MHRKNGEDYIRVNSGVLGQLEEVRADLPPKKPIVHLGFRGLGLKSTPSQELSFAVNKLGLTIEDEEEVLQSRRSRGKTEESSEGTSTSSELAKPFQELLDLSGKLMDWVGGITGKNYRRIVKSSASPISESGITPEREVNISEGSSEKRLFADQATLITPALKQEASPQDPIASWFARRHALGFQPRKPQ